MTTYTSNAPIDIAAIELEARKLRAEAVRNGVARFSRWAATPFHRTTRAL